MNSALKYAKEKNLVSVNVVDGVNLPKCVKKKKYRTIEIEVKTFSGHRELEIPDILFEEMLEEKVWEEQTKKNKW